MSALKSTPTLTLQDLSYLTDFEISLFSAHVRACMLPVALRKPVLAVLTEITNVYIGMVTL